MNFSERIAQISDPQQAAYFKSGYDAGRNGEEYHNAVQAEAHAGYEEECFYSEGFQLGNAEFEALPEGAKAQILRGYQPEDFDNVPA